jgi:hypothetical protein
MPEHKLSRSVSKHEHSNVDPLRGGIIVSLWKQQSGKFFCLSTKDPETKKWRDKFFHRDELYKVDKFLNDNRGRDIYACPHGFSRERRLKPYAVPPKLLWADLDERDPRKIKIKPTIAFESSPGRYVGLWVTDRPVTEELNRRLAYFLGSDKSGWDFTQVLRLISGTINHKYEAEPKVKIVWRDGPEYTIAEIEKRLPKDAAPGDSGQESDAAAVFKKYERKLPHWVRRELVGGKPVPGKRSEMLWKLEQTLIEKGLTTGEAFLLIKSSPWNKFAGRRDEDDQLRRELEKAVNHHFKASKAAAVRDDGDEDDGPLYDPWAECHAPPFPLDVLPPTMGLFVEAKAAETGGDVSSVAMAAMTVASAAITHETQLYLKPWGNFPVSARLWTVLVGPPSTKKSPATKGAADPLVHEQGKLQSSWRERKQEAKKSETSFDEPEPTQYIAYDTTPEKMADVLSRQDCGILCFHDELSGFIGALDRYSIGKGASSDRAFWLKAYDGGPYNVQRMSRETLPINNLSVSILGGIQPDLLRELKGLTSDGLLQRFLPVMMRKPQQDSDDFDHKARGGWEKLVKLLLQVEPLKIGLSPEAVKVRKKISGDLFAISQIGSEGTAFQGFVGKLDGVWGSLCLILHVLWHHNNAKEPVSAKTASMASRLIEDFILPHGMVFYRSVTGGIQEDHKAIGAFIARHDADMIKARDFVRGPNCLRGLTPDKVVNKLGPFVAGGWLTPQEYGPYCNEWAIDPRVKQEFARQAKQHADWVKIIQAKIIADMRSRKK